MGDGFQQGLPDGSVAGVVVDGEHILLCNVAGEHYAISNLCSHGETLLSDGKLRGYVITCPLHGARFDVRTGKCLGGPAARDVASFPVARDGVRLIVSTS